MNASTIASTIEALGWTLLHFVWQGAVVAMTLWCFLRWARKASPQIRYAAGCAALLLMSFGAASTFVSHLDASGPHSTGPPTATAIDSTAPGLAPEGSPVDPETGDDASLQAPRDLPAAAEPAAIATQPAASYVTDFAALASRLRPWLPWIVRLWAVGVVLLSFRLLAGWRVIGRMRREAGEPQDDVWIERFARLRQRLGVSRPVRLLCSASATVPMVIGWLKPVVLVPAGLLTGLSSVQLEAILAHELTHIRRHDYLVNLLQNVVETLFFYHPAVWWVSGQVRRQREHCCDDVASAVCGNTLDYARALTSLEELRRARAALGVAASGGSLLERVRRLAGVNQTDPRGGGWLVATAVLLLGAAVSLLPAAGGTLQRDVTLKPSTEAKDDSATTESNPGRNGIVISVLDSTGKKPIPKFRVLAGTRAGSVASEEFRKRTGRELVNWQPHTVRKGKDGGYLWSWDRAYDEMALRVEADGYQPQTAAWIRKSEGPKHVVFQLPEDPGVNGRVLQPDGKPAVGATVALTLAQRNAIIENGRIPNAGAPLPEKEGARWRRPTMVQTDAEGRFRLPTETDPASAVLVVHESGVREMATADFQKQPEITLKRWGRIEGQVLWKERPGADEPVTLSIYRDEYGYAGMIGCSAETRTDAEGRFVFDKVLPGRALVSRPVRLPKPGKLGVTAAVFDGLHVHIDVRPGEPTPVLIGGQGREVTGRLTGRASWEDVTFHFHPEAPHIGFPGDDARWKAFGVFRESDIGPLFFRDKLKPNADGTFEIPHLLPGRYQWFVSAPGVNSPAAYRVIKVDPETPGEDPPPLDLGEIPVREPEKMEEKKSEESSGPQRDKEKAPAKRITVRGKVVDDETGEPVAPLVTQAGKFDPADPTNVTWGYSEGRSGSRDGSFSTTVRWAEGWTARIIADGYVPQPVLTGPPPPDKDTIEVVIRLKRGRLVRGRVLDHNGRPVKGAAVFAVGPTGLNLAGGKAREYYRGEDDTGKPARTDELGRFELPAGQAKSLAVSSPGLDAWPSPVPEEGEALIRLPAPAGIDVLYRIEGGDAESTIFYELLSHDMPGFEGLESSREVPVKNGGRLELAAMPPGKYQICRQKMNHLGKFSKGAMLEREFLELKPGETKTIHYVREKGARLRGKVTWPEGTELAGVVVSVKSEKTEKDPFGGREWQTSYDSRTTAKDGGFLTERIAPGRYLLVAEGYTPLTDEQRWIVPAFRAETTVEVPESGEVAVPDLALAKVK